MFEALYNISNAFLGLDSELLDITHLALRGLVVYIYGLFIMRLNRRFIGIRTQANFILFVMLGSLLANAITGHYFFYILGMITFLLMVNWSLVILSYHSPFFSHILKGRPELLVENGEIRWRELQRNSITKDDLISMIRVQKGIEDIQLIKKLYLEDNGAISIILKK